jgi:hypothetical protein
LARNTAQEAPSQCTLKLLNLVAIASMRCVERCLRPSESGWRCQWILTLALHILPGLPTMPVRLPVAVPSSGYSGRSLRKLAMPGICSCRSVTGSRSLPPGPRLLLLQRMCGLASLAPASACASASACIPSQACFEPLTITSAGASISPTLTVPLLVSILAAALAAALALRPAATVAGLGASCHWHWHWPQWQCNPTSFFACAGYPSESVYHARHWHSTLSVNVLLICSCTCK